LKHLFQNEEICVKRRQGRISFLAKYFVIWRVTVTLAARVEVFVKSNSKIMKTHIDTLNNHFLSIFAVIAISCFSLGSCKSLNEDFPDNCIEATMRDGEGKHSIRSYFGNEMNLVLKSNDGETFSGHFNLEAPIVKDGNTLEKSKFNFYCDFHSIRYSTEEEKLIFNSKWVDATIGESFKFYNSGGDVMYDFVSLKTQISFSGYLMGDSKTLTPSEYAKNTKGRLKICLKLNQKEYRLNINSIVFTPAPEEQK